FARSTRMLRRMSVIGVSTHVRLSRTMIAQGQTNFSYELVLFGRDAPDGAAPCRSFGRLRQRISGDRFSLFPEHPGLQAIKVKIDDWRRIQGQDLRHGEAADDGVAERLANLGTDSGSYH